MWTADTQNQERKQKAKLGGRCSPSDKIDEKMAHNWSWSEVKVPERGWKGETGGRGDEWMFTARRGRDPAWLPEGADLRLQMSVWQLPAVVPIFSARLRMPTGRRRLRSLLSSCLVQRSPAPLWLYVPMDLKSGEPWNTVGSAETCQVNYRTPNAIWISISNK